MPRPHPRFSASASRPFSLPPFAPILLIVLAVVTLVSLFLFFPAQRPVFSIDSIQNCVDLNRTTYALTPSIFSDLPPAPKCFTSIVDAYRHHEFTDTNFFTAPYYLQPEFFPAFSTKGIVAWKNPIDTHYGAVGFGSYPKNHSASFNTLSSAQSFPFFIYSSFGIRSLQQMTLVARFENPSDANYISFSLDDESRRGFLIGPSFPKFSSDWSRRSVLTVTPLGALPDHPISIIVHTTRTYADFTDPRASQIPFFDSTDYIGEKDVYTLTLTPSS